MFKKDDGVAGATSEVDGVFRLLFLFCLVSEALSCNLLDDVFRGGGGGIEEEGNGSGETDSDDWSLCDPFVLRFRLVIEFRFRLMEGRARGE